MTISYNVNVPATNNNPSVDQPKMFTNTNAINTWVAVDHFGFNLNNSTPAGYHKTIHQLNQSTPVTIAGTNQIYVQNVTPNTTGGVTDTQLFCKTGLGGISQLTGNFASQSGYQWIGGVLIQWGINSAPITGSFANGNAAGTVTFKDRGATPSTIPFPNNCFVVIPNPFYAASDPNGSASVGIKTNISATAFNWKFNSNSAAYSGFYWIAIGN